jgi:sirohydrochlorin cobaltochelatase
MALHAGVGFHALGVNFTRAPGDIVVVPASTSSPAALVPHACSDLNPAVIIPGTLDAHPHRPGFSLPGCLDCTYYCRVPKDDFADAALVLVGHGSTLNAESAAPIYQHGDELRRRKIFAQVVECFWKLEPGICAVLRGVFARRVFVVPLFISEGYFTAEVIPRELGIPIQNSPVLRLPAEGPAQAGGASVAQATPGSKGGAVETSQIRAATAEGGKFKIQKFPVVQEQRERTLYYCGPVGTHPSMTTVILARAREVVDKHPFPRAPRAKEIALFIAGHGTGNNENSRNAIEQQVHLIRELNQFAEVHPVFLEEEPRIADCYRLAQARNIVMVPFFISDGLHSYEDIPVMLGEPERVVQTRLKQGQPTWRNPTEKKGKLVWYGASVGNEPQMAEVILERAREAAAGVEALKR